MKKIVKTSITGLFIALFTLTSCSDEDVIGSKVTIYPIITVSGESLTVLTEGDTYTELGAKSLAGEQELEVTTTGTVDTNTPGVYNIYYTSLNDDGFSTEKRRTVIVLSKEPSAINLEGTFFRSGNANVITRVSDRLYRASNAGGLLVSTPNDAKNLLAVRFYNIDDKHLYIPYQENSSQSGVAVESNIGTIVSENEFNYVLTASGVYGTALRVFKR